MRSYNVSLQGLLVGYLAEGQDGRISFRLTEAYRDMPQRPILSQWFEDEFDRVQRGKKRGLPAFFANLIPEPGPLRDLLEASLQIVPGDDLAMLEAVGSDLPGAVEVLPADDWIDLSNGGEATSRDGSDQEIASIDSGLRFSLAGVQMKFSVLRDPEKIALPAHDQRGDWIVKLDSARFPNVVENEFATMEWARSSGFDVPECHIQEISTLSDVMRGHGLPGTNVFVIRRYDRHGNRKVHQEDLAQVAGLRPGQKYDHLRYEQCAYLVGQIVGRLGYIDFIRRLVFVIASGNADAHLKNWSLVYPDGIKAALAPLYDQVSTIAWPDVQSELALKLAGTRNWFQIDLQRLGRLAELAREDSKFTMNVVSETLDEIVTGWNSSCARDVLPRKHLEALREFWRRVPLLRPYANAMTWLAPV